MTGFLPVRANECGTILPGGFHSPTFFWCALVFNAAFATVYVATDLNLFYDGSFFSLTIAVGRPWNLLWCNFPGRFAASYLLTAFPAQLYGDATGSASAAVRLYAILYICWPTIGIAATRLLDRTDDKHFSAYCNVASVTTPLFTFGFPTEVWITCALFWPTLCCCACTKHFSAPCWMFFLLLPLFGFTHEVSIVFFPLFFMVTAIFNHGVRRAFMLTAIVAVLACWVFVESYISPCFPWARSFIHASARNMLTPSNLVNSVSISIGAAMGGWLLAAAVINRTRTEPAKATLLPFVVGFVFLSIYTYYARDQIYGVERYPARTLVAVQTFGFGVLCVGSLLVWHADRLLLFGQAVSATARSMLGSRGTVVRRGITVFVVYSVVAHLYANAKFVRYWLALNTDLDEIVAGAGVVPIGFGLIALDEDVVTITRGVGVASDEWRLASSSVTSHVVMLAPGYDTKRLVHSLVTLTGGTCENAKALEEARGAIGPNINQYISM